MARNNNFALGLTVGIKNLFSRNAQEIRRDYQRLGRENRDLQSNLSDVTAYRDAQSELERLATSTSATTQEIRTQERAVRRLQQRLTEAGVDTRELTSEQQRLENQLRETQRAADSLDVSGSGMETLASFAGGAGVAFSLASAGGDVNKMERLAAAQTGLSLEDIQSSRNERLDVVEQTGLTSAEVLTAQVQALQSGFKGEDASELVMTSSQIQAAFPLQNQLEVMDAQTRMMRAFGISATQASDLFVAALQKGGDQELDLAKVVKEYAPTYADHGFNAETMMSLLAEGKRSGARDYDSVADPIKEMMNARLSDVDMFKKLMGDKDKKGSIDTLVTDKGLALDVKNAIYRVRDGVADGTVENQDFSQLFSTLVKVYELDRKAYRNIVEGVGGSRMAEDIGINQMKAYEKAFSNPNQVLGEYGGKTEQAADIAIRPWEHLMASFRSMVESASTVFTFAENEAEDQIKGGADVGFDSAAVMNDSPVAAGVGSSLAIGGAAAGGYAMLKYAPSILSNLQNRIAGGGTGTPPPNPPPAGSAAAGLARKAGVAGLVLSGGMLAKDLAEGDMEGASGMAGVIGGGLIGAKLGASVGALGGPIGVAIGGLIGSIGGSILGEEGASSLYDWMFGDDDDTEGKVNNQLQAISQGAETVHFQSEIDEPNNQIKAIKDGTDTVIYDSEINSPNQLNQVSNGTEEALGRYHAPHIKTEVSTLIEKSEMATSVITEKSMPQPIPIVLTINANVKADDNVTVSEDFEDRLIATLREATPELMMQLSQTLDDHILELS